MRVNRRQSRPRSSGSNASGRPSRGPTNSGTSICRTAHESQNLKHGGKSLMIDRDAIIAEQQAAEAARLAIPGRYDGTLVKDIARKLEMEHMTIHAWRSANDVDTV